MNVAKNFTVKKRLITDKSILEFKNKLHEVDWNQIYDIDDVNDCYDKFMSILYYVYDKCFPEIVKKPVLGCKFKRPWLTNGLLKSIQKKHRLYKTYFKNPNQKNKKMFTHFRNKLTGLLRIAKNNYYSSVFDKIKSNTKEMWNQINDILGKRKTNNLPTKMYNHDVK